MKKWLSLPVLALLLTSCGTLIHSNPQSVLITSDPSGAIVRVDGEDRGATPVDLELDVDESHEVTVEASGYAPETRRIERSLSIGVIVIDVLFGLVPLAIDAVLDSLHTLDPDEMHFQFAPVSAPAPQDTRPAFEWNSEPEPDTDARDSADAYCCINGQYYSCPSAAAVAQCAPPELASCMMSCGGMDFECPEQCLASYPPDPSGCDREPSQDSACQ